MINNDVLEEFFVWEEKNSTDLNQNLLKNEKQDNCVTTIETKTDSMPSDWRTITDPKLRKKMRMRAYDKSRYSVLKLKRKEYCLKNKDRTKKNRDLWRKKNREKIRLQQCQYAMSNKKKLDVYQKQWHFDNKDKIRERNTIRRQNDFQYKLKIGLRDRLRKALHGNYKNGSAVKDLGCSIDELKIHLESKFQSGMSWDNYGFYGWHIDHIVPLASFDLTDRKQFLEVCHYTNLQPLWAKDNLSKGDSI